MTAPTIPCEVESSLRRSEARRQWRRIGVRHLHGVNVPVFSLRTEYSSGIGEYLDLIPFIDWCSDLGFQVLQLLPINDSGPDSSPYNAQTAFGLNPLHISLRALHGWKSDATLSECIAQLDKANKLKRVDYEKIRPLRSKFLERYYELFGAEQMASPSYAHFCETHSYWLPGYALFKALKDQDSRHWKHWPKPWQAPSQSLADEHAERMNYYAFLQYLCFHQMSSVKQHAESADVLVKGDLPILISPDSAEVWQFRQYFRMDWVAGAPPDMYSPKGQKWGFPLYDWEALEQDENHWWAQRLKAAESCYHLYRLDHIAGFFRIWAIPSQGSAKDGHYEPVDESLWIPQGQRLLKQLLGASKMLPIGEDLGVVPPGARECMTKLGIPGTKVLRWERAWEQDEHFLDPKAFPPLSMSTVSTHDSETLSLWWTEQKKEAQAYAKQQGWDYAPELSHTQRYAILSDCHRSSSLLHINLLQEYLALVPDLVWSKPTDERINVPGQLAATNWSYRIKPTIEDLSDNEALAHEIRLLLTL